jgi:hypothetical protein
MVLRSPLPSDPVAASGFQPVFWLSDRQRRHAFPPACAQQWLALRLVTRVPDYSGGTATESHRVPKLKPQRWYGPGTVASTKAFRALGRLCLDTAAAPGARRRPTGSARRASNLLSSFDAAPPSTSSGPASWPASVAGAAPVGARSRRAGGATAPCGTTCQARESAGRGAPRRGPADCFTGYAGAADTRLTLDDGSKSNLAKAISVEELNDLLST